MKATVKFVDGNKIRQKTLQVEKNEPNSIIREFYNAGVFGKFTYITTIKCGRYEYQWNGEATEAGIY